jgi:hypothetical protein
MLVVIGSLNGPACCFLLIHAQRIQTCWPAATLSAKTISCLARVAEPTNSQAGGIFSSA